MDPLTTTTRRWRAVTVFGQAEGVPGRTLYVEAINSRRARNLATRKLYEGERIAALTAFCDVPGAVVAGAWTGATKWAA